MASKHIFSSAMGLGLLAAASATPFSNRTVRIESGLVQGVEAFNQSFSKSTYGTPSTGVTKFLGIPYAADTGYSNRWKPPQKRQPWNETFLAASYGTPCPSTYATDWSEDCLSVNIWTPANSSAEKLPVMVWNYGGGQTSSDITYDGTGLAREGIVVVTYNYRDGVFGWLAHPELLAESQHNTTGNYGVADWFYMLDWIQENIAEFGGDPEKVTIAGQSAGSAQVYHALNSELTRGKFRAAISESGVRWVTDTLDIALAESYYTMPEALFIGENYTSFHNASSVSQLRNLSADVLLNGSEDRQYTIWWVTALSSQYPSDFKPVFDGYYIPSTYKISLLEGTANDVPILTGNNKDESGANPSTNYTIAEYTNYTELKYGDLASQYLKLWSAGANYTTASEAWNAAARDTSIIGTYMWANAWIEHYTSPIWTYYWDHAPPGQSQGAFHQSEIEYAFNNLYTMEYPYTEADQVIADQVTAYWANFIKTMDPNKGSTYAGDNLTAWPANEYGKPTVQHIGDGFGQMPVVDEARREFIMAYFNQTRAF